MEQKHSQPFLPASGDTSGKRRNDQRANCCASGFGGGTEQTDLFIFSCSVGPNKGDSLDIPESVENEAFLEATSISFPACFRSLRRQLEKQRAKRAKRLGQLDDAFPWREVAHKFDS